ncbi:hypothetical protein KDH_14830 [Dictyobacter sp. S3.2.2.5]|uniref:Uncharacterized protein n=1 Tax=Dictyobacter halimunensis TaxID=3026934 RepID=A0ABQ6FK63_9CHLR|nr:hypothetical protein KDH_14830 [Dictyobacter sp. S3.2.2.5]
MVWLDSQRENGPPFLFTLLLNELLTPLCNVSSQNGFPSPWTPDEMINNEMNVMLISLILKWLFHGLIRP